VGQDQGVTKKRKSAKSGARQQGARADVTAAPGRWRGWLAVGVVLLATAFLYAPALNHQFTNWDDDRQITANPDIRDLSPQGVGKMFSSFYVSLYQPLTSLGFAVQYRLFGLDPRVYHTVNVLLHLANIVLVYLFVRSLASQAGIALVVAALFAVHPLQVEVAAWASSLSILLSSLFYVGAMTTYVAYVRSGRKCYFAGVLVLFLLALLAKTTAATLPLMLLVIDLYLQRKICLRTLGEKIPFFVLSLVFGIITMCARSGVSHAQDYALKYSLLQRVCIVCYSCLWYVGKLLFPAGLSVFYPFPNKPNGWLPVLFYLAPVLLVGLAVGIYWAGRYRRLLACTALFMLAALVLVVQIIPVSELMVCDRYAYIPGIGLFFLAGTLCQRLGTRSPSWRRAVWVGAALVLAVLGGATYRRVGVWRDSMTLWNDVIGKRQDIWVAYLNRGLAESQAGDHRAAIADFDATLQLNPKADKAWNNRAVSYVYLGDRAAALRDFDNAIRLNPESSYLVNRGILKRDTGDFAGALKDFNAVLEHNPRNAGALCERADAYRHQGSWASAQADYEAVLRLRPGHAHAAFWLGAVLLETGDGTGAVTMLNRALALGYKDPSTAYLLLAKTYEKLGRPDLMREALRRSQEMGPGGLPAPGPPSEGSQPP
jgi:tetratricopeptide (TPR) repeat protein